MTDTAYWKSDNWILRHQFRGTQDLGLLKWDQVSRTTKYLSTTLDTGPVTPYFMSLEIIVTFSQIHTRILWLLHGIENKAKIIFQEEIPVGKNLILKSSILKVATSKTYFLRYDVYVKTFYMPLYLPLH